jgi:uncharacterized protein
MRLFLLITSILISFSLFCQPPGTVLPKGKPGVDFNVKDAKGKKHGVWVQQWKQTGNLFYKGQFEHGLPVGEWQHFNSNGALAAIMNHVKDSTIVDVVFYHPDGVTKASEGRFIQKKKEGNWKIWSEAGIELADENFKDSLLDGTCKYFYPSGKPLKIENYKHGLQNGAFTEYYENGKKRAEGSYSGGEKDGPYKAWFESGNLDCEGKYVKGFQDGGWYYYHETGKPKVSLSYKRGTETKRRYENGTFKEYYDSTIPKSEYTYQNAQKDGPFTEWYDKGEYVQVPVTEEEQSTGIRQKEQLQGTQVRMHGDYVDDKLEGEVMFYRENGAVEKVEEWSDGVLIKTRTVGK